MTHPRAAIRIGVPGGYTLIELLIVMAVLAAVAGLTLPAMRGPMDKSRLTGAAKQVQTALAKARSLAIREGAAVQFRYEIFGSRFVIERIQTLMSAPIIVMSESDGLNSTPSGLSAESGSTESSGGENPSGDTTFASEATAAAADGSTFPGNTVLRDGEIPTGVIFDEAPVVANESTTTSGSSLLTPEVVAGQTEATTVPHWSEPIRFEPSGRTRDQTIHLSGQRDFTIVITLRGLTSTASYSAPTRRMVATGSTSDLPSSAATPSEVEP